ncbi:MAG TPA: type II secretion system F family protein, partial [Solirubrobacteraceae bacterium]|nr:type II secretion system F family protein [Solirubrobacteraceae bacterium]
GRRVGPPRAPDGLARRIEAAGAPARVSSGDVMAVKCGAAALALLAFVPLLPALPGRLGAVAFFAAPAAGFLAPDLWLRRRARARGRAMAAEMADVLDLLHVAIDAGLAPMRAIGEVGRRRGGPLAAELRRLAARVELGVPAADALASFESRCPVEGAHALGAALARAERHGAPLGPVLGALAADARARRAQRLRERAARAAPKIQLVVALLLVPAVMLLVAAALLAGLR